MRVRLWRRDLTLDQPVAAAEQVHSTRPHLFLELEIDGVVGLGEISPQPVSLNGDAGIDDVLSELELFTLPQITALVEREGRAPHWARVTHLAGSRSASHPASALLEMALLDAELRTRGAAVEELWTPRFETPWQSTVSLVDSGPWPPNVGAARVRAKVSPLTVPDEQWTRLAALDMPVLLDFNCSGGTVELVMSSVTEARRHVDVVAVEQPFAPGNVVEHAQLAAALDLPVSLDEGVRNRRDLDQIVRYGAAKMVCVKPARVGGYAQARTLIDRAGQLGLTAYVGGFFESPLGRRANHALALHCVAEPSDIAPVALGSAHVLTEDPHGWGFVPGPDLESATPVVFIGD